MPTVINRHHFRDNPLPEPWIYIGRGTPLGNPYRVVDHGMAALPLYRRWLWAQITMRTPAVMDTLSSITPGHHLVCSCAPRPCHGNVVVRAWQWTTDQGILDVWRNRSPRSRS